MAIAKRPKKTTPIADDERERQEQAFLAAAPDSRSAPDKLDKVEDSRMQTVHLRFDPEMLRRIDAASKELGLGSRSAWVRYAVMQALKQQGS